MGIYDAHVMAFYSVPKTNFFEVYDPLTGSTNIFDLDQQHYSLPYARNPVPALNSDDQKFLDDLYVNSGIKAAGRRTGRLRGDR